MAFNLGDIFVTLKANTDKFSKGIREAEVKLSHFQTAGSKVTTALGGMAKAGIAAGTILAGTGAVLATKVGKNALQTASDLEQIEIAFGTMLGSAEKASALLNDITKAAAETPFELPELQGAAQKLLAFGVGSDQVVGTLTRLGDVAAGVSAPVGEIAFVYGQIRAQQQAYTQDLNQFASRGIPIYEEVASVLGMSVAELREGMGSGEIKVNFDTIQTAFENMTNEGGKFAGLMSEQSKSLSGIVSNLKDNFSLMAVDVLKSSGAFDAVKGAAQKLLDALNENKDAIGAFIADGIKKAIDFLGRLWSWVVENKDEIIAFGTTLWDIAKGAFTFFRDIIQKVTEFLEKNRSKIREVWDVIKALFIPIIEQIISSVKRAIEEFRKNKVAMEGLKWMFIIIGGAIITVVAIFLGLIMVLAKLIEWSTRAANWLGDRFNQIKDANIRAFNAMKSFISHWAGVIWSIIQGAWNRIVGAIAGAYWRIRNAIIAPFQDAVGEVGRIAQRIKDKLDKINPFHRESPSLVDWVEMGTERIAELYGGLSDELSSTTVPVTGMAEGANATGRLPQQQAPAGAAVTQNVYIDHVGDEADADMLTSRLAYKMRGSLS